MIHIAEGIMDPMYGMKATFKGTDADDRVGMELSKYKPGTVVTIISSPKSSNDVWKVEFPDGKKYKLFTDEIDYILSDNSDDTKFDKILNRIKSKVSEDVVDINKYRNRKFNKHDHYVDGKCSVCGNNVIIDTPVGAYRSSDYIDNWDICFSCMLEHCAETSCLKCEYGNNSNCRFKWIKQIALDADE